MHTVFLQSPIGMIEIVGNIEGVSSILFKDDDSLVISENIPKELIDVVTQLQEYFDGKRSTFNVKISPKGTNFQKRVWNELLNIPFGQTLNYKQIANNLGDPKVIRAAASANGKNPISIIIPCHRVIGSDGSLTGYAGGLHRKKWLLEHENPSQQQSLF
ncbi:methylated-DNA--[protein]-cysteine S-methyltransferase [Aequorivita xiaoshiensis]|uniref:Methylated-DNA--protein-cysteine methyltransferase n=1 Tax=Aequorivita xiaoshiensis TaxID=2874476 RepID=A0A9X1R3W4_9FLAO|nr:methylated-DNA--[protein]-cysteine S-methyltransferase [Aequorivita xiaoshiensis]MCG2430569.1 methylated-DNA--[protein]-cysteine S-methyltransferase [Aequorivita xiaoshiensis]